jgi:hypothetical protein
MGLRGIHFFGLDYGLLKITFRTFRNCGLNIIEIIIKENRYIGN